MKSKIMKMSKRKSRSKIRTPKRGAAIIQSCSAGEGTGGTIGS